MSNTQIIAILNDLMSGVDAAGDNRLTFKEREALSWAIAKLTK